MEVSRRFLDAVSEGNLVKALGFLKTNPKLVNQVDPKGYTALHYAVSNRRHAMVKKLMHFDSSTLDVATKKRKETPLLTAVRLNDIEMATLLIRLGSKALDIPDRYDMTPIYWAVANDYLNMLKLLINAGAKAVDVTSKHNFGDTPLYVAASNGNRKMVEVLIKAGAATLDKPDMEGTTPLMAAVRRDDRRMIRQIILLGSNALDTPDKKGRTPLFFACEADRTNMAIYLIRLGSNALDTPDKRGRTPISWAAANGNMKLVSYLLDHGAGSLDTPDTKGRTPLYHAVDEGHVEMVAHLLRLGSNALDTPTKYGWTPLQLAVRLDDVALVESHLAQSTSFNRRPDTPIWLAARYGDPPKMLELLFGLGSRDLDTPDIIDGHTPLHVASIRDSSETIITLVKLGATGLDTPDKHGYTPMICAIKAGAYDVVDVLRALGADTNTALQQCPKRAGILTKTLDEDFVLDIRYKAYRFGESLVARLLLI